MTQKRSPDDWIDGLLDDIARTPVDQPSTDLMARILADALAEQPAPGGVASSRGWRKGLWALGGWASLSGLVAATVVGFAVGLGGVLDAGLLAIDASWTESSYYQDALNANGWYLEDG
ncbi:MAG: hypothetical protein AAF601_07740 [Pseudomonadota bacterium]